jgi:aminopeptidase
MSDPSLQRLAHLLVHYSTRVAPGDRVLINATTAAEPFVQALYEEVVRAGGLPHVRLEFADQEYLLLAHGDDDQVGYVDPYLQREAEEMDVLLRVYPDLNPHALSGVDAERKQLRARGRGPAREALMRRLSDGSLRAVIAPSPSAALAQEARMSEHEHRAFVLRSCGLDEDDPVAWWEAIADRQQVLCDRLDRVEQLRFVGLDTDLSMDVTGRRWINCCGLVNMPDGEVFTGPIEDSANGIIRFTYPGIFQGEGIEDIRLTFEAGRVVEATAAQGQELLDRVLETDEGARGIGEIAIGTNAHIQRFTRNMLFDEKMGGTIHLALGAGIPSSGSVNRSAIHWDLLKDMTEGEIIADGEVIYRNGAFVQTSG